MALSTADVQHACLQFGHALPLISHLLFMILWLVIISTSRDADYSFTFGELARERMVRTELLPSEAEVATNFGNVSSLSDVSKFLRGPMLSALFGEQVSRVSGDFDAGWVNAQSKLVGAVRLRQVRVATNSCSVTLLRVLGVDCYPDLSAGRRRVAPIYGENLGGGMRRVYRYRPPERPELGGIPELPAIALVHGYLPGGYVVDLPARRLHAAAVLNMMEHDRFLSIETRLLTVDYSLYNANVNMFCVVRLAFEHLQTGGVKTYAAFRTVRLLAYEGEAGAVQHTLDGLLVTYTVLLALLHARALRIQLNVDGEAFSLRAYALHFSVWVDWAFLLLAWLMLASKFAVRSAMDALEQKQTVPGLVDRDTHIPLYDVASTAQLEANFASLASLLVVLKLFKYLRRVPLFARLLAALSASVRDLCNFLITFAFVLSSFALAFHVAYGGKLDNFASFGISCVTLLGYVLGKLDLAPLLFVNDIIAVAFSTLFILTVRLVLAGLAVSILIRHVAAQPYVADAETARLTEAFLRRRDQLLRLRGNDLAKVLATVSDALGETVDQVLARLSPPGMGGMGGVGGGPSPGKRKRGLISTFLNPAESFTSPSHEGAAAARRTAARGGAGVQSSEGGRSRPTRVGRECAKAKAMIEERMQAVTAFNRTRGDHGGNGDEDGLPAAIDSSEAAPAAASASVLGLAAAEDARSAQGACGGSFVGSFVTDASSMREAAGGMAGGIGGIGGTAVGGAASGGWLVGDLIEDPEDPMKEAERAFARAAEDAGVQAVTETQSSTDHLKELYLHVLDMQQSRLEKIETVRSAICALRDENYAIASALKREGVVLSTALDATIPQERPEPTPRTQRALGTARALDSAEKTLEEVLRAAQGLPPSPSQGESGAGGVAPAEESKGWGALRSSMLGQAVRARAQDGPPPPGVASAAALLSLAAATRRRAAAGGVHMDQQAWASSAGEGDISKR